MSENGIMLTNQKEERKTVFEIDRDRVPRFMLRFLISTVPGVALILGGAFLLFTYSSDFGKIDLLDVGFFIIFGFVFVLFIKSIVDSYRRHKQVVVKLTHVNDQLEMTYFDGDVIKEIQEELSRLIFAKEIHAHPYISVSGISIKLYDHELISTSVSLWWKKRYVNEIMQWYDAQYEKGNVPN